MGGTKRKQRRPTQAKKKAKIDTVTAALEQVEKTQHKTRASTDQLEDKDCASMAQPLLSAELIEEFGRQDAGGVLVLPGHREKKQKVEQVPDELLNQAQHMSKRKRKKLEAIAAKKVKDARREGLYQSLAKQQLSRDQMKLLYSTSKMGHKETLRERLRRSLNRQQAGLALSEDAQKELYQTKNVSPEEEPIQDSIPSEPSRQTARIEAETGNDATAGTKKRRKQKPSIPNRAVPMVAPQDNAHVPSTRFAGPAALPDQEEPDSCTSSQRAAMTKLQALRKKNDDKRCQRARATTTGNNEPLSADSTVVDAVYVPQPIAMTTADERRKLSQTTTLSYKTTLVTLSRKPAIQLARMQLPVCSSEQEIMEAILANDVMILCGETGSGKTTQVPQFLYEAGFGHAKHPRYSGRIGVTQPRRVAAVSTAQRVAEELNVPFGAPNGHVGYQIRYDASHVSPHTRIKFMTDGILLKEIQQDFLLRQYSILLLDEAHERNVNTDILIGLLSRIAPLRAQLAREEEEAYARLSRDEQAEAKTPSQPLKLVIMSATLRVEDFTLNHGLFPTPPPVLRIEARQYPVTVHFNKRTELDNYVAEAYKKVVKIHTKLPEGGVLVFLTGQREIVHLCRQLSRSFARKGLARCRAVRAQHRHSSFEVEPSTTVAFFHEHDDIEEDADEEEAQEYGTDVDEHKDVASDKDEEDEGDDELAVPYMHVLPLYSLLPNDEQMKVFETPPENHRLIVVATNVAETSLTIPGIKYVVDAGRTKDRVFDLATGISSFQVQWISKASADQRAGRAGRTCPGHCYRLYSSAVYDTEFPTFALPAILCQPIDDLVLQMKAMGIHAVLQFPFPTPPDHEAVQHALATLVNLGAVSSSRDESITTLGRALVQFPVAARFAKMLLLAKQLKVIEYTIAIVAALSGHVPFLHARDCREKETTTRVEAGNEPKERDDMDTEWRKAEERRKHAQWVHHESDVLSLLLAAGAYAYSGGSHHFCTTNHLHEKTMQDMLKLRYQLTRIVNKLYAEEKEFKVIHLESKMPPPDLETQSVLRQIVAAGFVDHVAKRVPAGTITEGSKIERNCAYIAATGSIKEPLYIHPHSSVFTSNSSKLPEFVVYQHVMRTTRAYMKTVTAIEPEWLARIGKNTPLCKQTPPLAEPAPFYNGDLDEVQCYAKAQFGIHQWSLPAMRITYPDVGTMDAKGGLADKYRWFAKFLLDGQVITSLIPFSNALRESSHTLIRKKFDKKIQLLVAKLQQCRVASRRALVAKWSHTDGKLFLKEELLSWIKESHQIAFSQAWSSLVKAAVQEEKSLIRAHNRKTGFV